MLSDEVKCFAIQGKLMRTAVICFLSVLLGACAGLLPIHYRVNVHAVAQVNVESPKSYFLMPGNSGVTWQNKDFKLYADYLWRALNERGYTYSSDAQQADILITLSYGVSQPQAEEYTYSVPQWSARTVNGTTTMVITGHTYHTAIRYNYTKFIKVIAYDYRDTGEQGKAPLWQVSANNINQSNDLKTVFPALLAAVTPLIAKNSEANIEKVISENDHLVTVIQGQPKQSQ